MADSASRGTILDRVWSISSYFLLHICESLVLTAIDMSMLGIVKPSTRKLQDLAVGPPIPCIYRYDSENLDCQTTDCASPGDVRKRVTSPHRGQTFKAVGSPPHCDITLTHEIARLYEHRDGQVDSRHLTY